jgi:hypothetical protein
MGTFMSDIALDNPIGAQAVTQSNASHFGIATMVMLAVASAVLAFHRPGTIGLEYQSVDGILTGR